jgi:HEAT repeat protein
VFDRAAKLCRSSTAGERALGADILGQLGIPERAFPEESFAAVLKLLSDSDINVLCSAILALQHIDAERAAAHVTPFSNHPNEDVRSAVAFALCGVEGEAALRTLLSLAKDEDGDVRNWATFGLGQQSEADTPEVREALAAGLRDREEDVRSRGDHWSGASPGHQNERVPQNHASQRSGRRVRERGSGTAARNGAQWGNNHG